MEQASEREGEQARKGSKPESKKRGCQRAREGAREWESCSEGTRQQGGEQRGTQSVQVQTRSQGESRNRNMKIEKLATEHECTPHLDIAIFLVCSYILEFVD